MPKGVYDRSGRGKSAVKPSVIQSFTEIAPSQVDTRSLSIGVNTAVVDKNPEPGSANALVRSERQTHGDDSISTTERLFGDIGQAQEEGADADVSQQPGELPPVTPVAQNPEQAEKISKIEEPKTEEPRPSNDVPSKDDEFLDWEKLSGKKVRLKVDGREVIATAEDLKKYSDQEQIKRHLAEAADKVGDERRKLAEERKQLNELRQQRQQQYEAPIPQNGMPNAQIAPQYREQIPNDPVMARIQYLESQIQQMANSTAPVIFQSNRIALDNSLKARGFNDFNDYWPKIVANVDPHLIAELNGNEMRAAELTYFQLKAQDMASAPAKRQVENGANALVSQSVSRRTIETQIPQAQIDSGSSSGQQVNDDGAYNYRQAFKRAVASGDDREAWNEVLRQKGVLPS